MGPAGRRAGLARRLAADLGRHDRLDLPRALQRRHMMIRLARLAAACTFIALMAACAALAPAPFAPGSPVANVTQRMGAPSGDYALPGGGHRLEYSGGAYGRQTTMFDFHAAGG